MGHEDCAISQRVTKSSILSLDKVVMSDMILDVRDLHTYIFSRWGVVKAVDGVSFTVREGETLGIVGESGSGKTMTSLSLLRLIPRPAARIVKGEIWLDGENLMEKSDKDMRQVRGRKIAMILQDPQTSLNPVFSIGNQLIEAIRIHYRAARQALLQRAEEALRMVRVAAPAERLNNYPHQMSGGMKQRVVGAIAISCAPKVLIADEPTTALDVTIQLQYLKLLKEIQAETNMAMIFITHDFGIVARVCDQIAVMYAGRIVERGPVRDVFNHPSHPYTQALLASVPRMEERTEWLASIEGQPPALHDLPEGCRFAPRCAYADERCHTTYPPSFVAGTGHTADCWRLEGIMTTSLLRVQGVRKYFPVTKGLLIMRTVGHVKAVDGVSFEIKQGETLGLVGESGCGKTTTSRLILRLETPTEGDVLLNGKSIYGLERQDLRDYRTAVQAVFQDPWASLNPRQRVRDIIAEPLIVNTTLSPAEVDKRVEEVLVQVGLRPDFAQRYPHEFSGGQRQRIALAGALASYPKLIVLDEPVSALDVSIRAQIMNLLKRLQQQSQVSYLLVAHNLATVRYMAHQTAVMYLGQIRRARDDRSAVQ